MTYKLFAFLLMALPTWAISVPLALTPGERVLESFEVGSNVVARSVFVDRSSNSLWVGTSVGALEIDLKTQNLRKTFTRQNGLASEYVFSIGTDSQGNKWLGTNSGGATRIKDGKVKTYFPLHGLADYWVYGFANDKNGNMWIATRAGVNLFNVKTGEFKTYAKELVNEWVYGVAVDNAGRAWFGTHGGVSMFDGTRWKSWNHQNGVGAPDVNQPKARAPSSGSAPAAQDTLSYNPDYVLSIISAPDNSVWAGTLGGGVSRFDGKSWTNLTTRDGLAGNIVYAIVRDRNGIFWFGTDNGVSRYDGKSWKSFGLHEGLLDKNVYALTLAPNGDLWAGTGKGVTRIGLDQSKR